MEWRFSRSNCTVTSMYKPPNTPFAFTKPANFDSKQIRIVVGDFNSHSMRWGYRETDEDGCRVEDWAAMEDLQLIHDPKLPCSFNSGRWRRGYNPDLVFVTDRISQMSVKDIGDPIPSSQHRPVTLKVLGAVRPVIAQFKRRFNFKSFKRAQWESFATGIDARIADLSEILEHYDDFIRMVGFVSRRTIPRGCRVNYIPGLSQAASSRLSYYGERYAVDPFSEETLDAGEDLLQDIADSR